MTESEYLYGINVNEFIDMPYKQAIEYKLKAGKKLHSELFGKDETHEDRVRLFKVQKAIWHNERLTREWE